MVLDSDSTDESDGEYLGETDNSSDSSEEAQYVVETYQLGRFLLPALAVIPDLSNIHRMKKSIRKAKKNVGRKD
ncbi:hypothetical protein PIB30_049600 [Stylosanthes scabra]|uniref:Uncharacterized protein n=1 Tax=Stylosanthes scabra TaxID=79078 RepID=A0ABU6WJC4_9FABA|nr:hypothetical protein [Stylosanthes scabra]